MRKIEHIDDIVRDSFGLWVTSLFSAITTWNPVISLDEHKEIFFSLIEILLRSGRIKFIAPSADCYISAENPHPRLTIYDEEAHWNETPETIVTELRSLWPSQVNDANDPDLAVYFYSIPGVIWVADDGTLVAS